MSCIIPIRDEDEDEFGTMLIDSKFFPLTKKKKEGNDEHGWVMVRISEAFRSAAQIISILLRNLVLKIELKSNKGLFRIASGLSTRILILYRFRDR